MTGTTSLFPRNAFIGFDHLLGELDFVTKHSGDNYPPYNILKRNDTDYLIEVAVAGFSMDELSVEVKDRTLTVQGEHESKGRDYVHRGISTKKFKRIFRLSEHVQVKGADLKDGLLSIELKYEVPQELRPRSIPIGKNEESQNDKQLLTENNQLV